MWELFRPRCMAAAHDTGAFALDMMDTENNVAEIAMKHGYKFSPRLHVDLFGNRWGT